MNKSLQTNSYELSKSLSGFMKINWDIESLTIPSSYKRRIIQGYSFNKLPFQSYFNRLYLCSKVGLYFANVNTF